MVCHNLTEQKLTKKIGSLILGFARPGLWGAWSQVSNLTIQLLLCLDCENLANIHSSNKKLFNFFLQTEGHILHPSMLGEYFCLH